MAEVNPSRRYVSPLRGRAAEQTRQAVLAAAEALFVEQGYVATTVEQIAARAGIAKPTVFASVGSKSTLLKQLRDYALAGDEQPLPVVQRPWYQEALREPDPERALRLYARTVVRMHQRYAAFDEVLHAAAAADEELRDLWHTSEAERWTGASYVVDALLTKCPLKPGLDRDHAIDLLWALTATDSFRRLVRHRGWSTHRYQQWLGDTFCDQLLARSPACS